MFKRVFFLVTVGSVFTANAAWADILAGWDVDLSAGSLATTGDPSLDDAQIASGIASAQLLGGTAVAPGVSILSGTGGSGVDLHGGIASSTTTSTNITIGLDNVGVGSSNLYRGIYAVNNWFIEGDDAGGAPYPIDLDKYLSFRISSTDSLDLDTFEMVVRNQVMNTPSRVRNVYAAFSTDGLTFTDYVGASADGDPADDSIDDPPSKLQGNFLVGSRGGEDAEYTTNPHKVWDLSEFSGVNDLWIRVQARGLTNSAGENKLDPLSWLAIDDRGDLNTSTPLDLEANANNPFASPYDEGVSDDGFDVILTGVVADAGGLEGDFNGDGSVDAADYTVWRDNYGAVEDELVLSGNGDGGVVDVDDYLLWRNNYGTPEDAASVVAVPEPAALTFVLAGITALAGRRR